jgi:hypothetical protein
MNFKEKSLLLDFWQQEYGGIFLGQQEYGKMKTSIQRWKCSPRNHASV